MRILHTQGTRGIGTNEYVQLSLGNQGKSIILVSWKAGVGYRNIPAYVGPLGNVTLDSVIALVPAHGTTIQGSATEWLSWRGRIPIRQDVGAVILDITEVVATYSVELVVGVSDE